MSSWVIFLALLLVPGPGSAAGLTVQSGASVSVGGGSINVGCNDVSVVGDLNVNSGSILQARHVGIPGGKIDAGSGKIELAGNWSNGGTFTPGSSQVTIQDGCSTTISDMSGDTDFYTFMAMSSSGKTLTPASGSTQVFKNSLTLKGALGSLMLIRSSTPGSQAFFSLDPDGSQTIFAVDVQDNNALGGQWLAPDFPPVFDSVDSGNNRNWFKMLVELHPVPALSKYALVLLALALMAVAFRRRRYIDPNT